MNIQDLSYIIAKEYKERNNYGISRTKLIKLAYLAEIFYKRQTRERLTDSIWVFWKFGPYLLDYPDILNSEAFNKSIDEDFQPVNINTDYVPNDADINEKTAIFKALEFVDEDLNDILDFVYFDTEPMMHATSRGEELNFDLVKPEAAYRIKKYYVNEPIKRDIKRKIEAWKKRKSATT